MAKVDFRRVATNADLENLDIKDGQFIVTGEGRAYVDYGNERKSFIGLNSNDVINLIYPIGSIYISVNNVNPSTLFGGTWEAFGSGRTLVGVDTTQTEFDTIEKQGGSKYLQEHNHVGRVYFSGNDSWQVNITDVKAIFGSSGVVHGGDGLINAGENKYTWDVSANNPYTHAYEMSTASTENTGNGNSQNLQPYITVYMWKRTA